MTKDYRLNFQEIIRVSQEELIKRCETTATFPAIVFKGRDAIYYDKKENFDETLDVVGKTSKDLQFYMVSGNHYLHLNNPEDISELTNSFIKKHNVSQNSEARWAKSIQEWK